jgi:hypothetical protein
MALSLENASYTNPLVSVDSFISNGVPVDDELHLDPEHGAEVNEWTHGIVRMAGMLLRTGFGVSETWTSLAC